MSIESAPQGVHRASVTESLNVLYDKQGRCLDYLRLAVTDRCNLRCQYCMPEEGVRQFKHDDILSFEELHRLVSIFCDLGVKRVRVTGGEPLVRHGVIEFLSRINQLPTHPEILLTTNGVLLQDCLSQIKAAGVNRINLSLDSLDRKTYQKISRRDSLNKVLPLLDSIPNAGMELKVNMVILPGINDHEIPDFARLSHNHALQVRFIEPMPFDGCGDVSPYDGDCILDKLSELGQLDSVAENGSRVAETYKVAGWQGTIGIIRGHKRTFCNSCNRLRIDAQGRFRNCLYGEPEASLKELVRKGESNQAIKNAICDAVGRKYEDGIEAERLRENKKCESMANIGG
ncbi:MAG: GTP 3',8-cyclase MoaA [bacterium]|nr:GTP 3',8-cyclase MoaA [bacterium]MCP4798953.1 GTP 3',8-cyclase MoaA [bacterium]